VLFDIHQLHHPTNQSIHSFIHCFVNTYNITAPYNAAAMKLDRKMQSALTNAQKINNSKTTVKEVRCKITKKAGLKRPKYTEKSSSLTHN